MDMEEHKREQEELIKSLKKQLDWYTFEAGTDEINLKKINSILELLKDLEPLEDDYFNPEKGLERFWKYYECRQAEENAELNSLKEEEDRELEEMLAREENASVGSIIPQEVFAAMEQERQAAREKSNRPEEALELETAEARGTRQEKGGEEKKKKDRLLFLRRHKGATGTIAAAMVVMTVLVSGTVGAYAEKDTGFFHWLSKDEDGRGLIVSPSLENNTDDYSYNRYNNINEVPSNIKGEVWGKEELINGADLAYIEVIYFNNVLRIQSMYEDTETDLYVQVDKAIYQNEIVIQHDVFDSYEELDSQKIENLEVDFYKKESEDEIEYMSWFANENKQYSIHGNLTMEDLQALIGEYIRSIK